MRFISKLCRTFISNHTILKLQFHFLVVGEKHGYVGNNSSAIYDVITPTLWPSPEREAPFF